MRKQKASTPFLLGVFAALLACTSHTLAADEAGTVKTLKGTATIERNGSKASDEHDLDVRVQFRGPASQFDAIHFRHDNVGQEQSERFFA